MACAPGARIEVVAEYRCGPVSGALAAARRVRLRRPKPFPNDPSDRLPHEGGQAGRTEDLVVALPQSRTPSRFRPVSGHLWSCVVIVSVSRGRYSAEF